MPFNLDRHKKLHRGLPRRDFLRIGSLAMTGLSLPQLFAAESVSRPQSPKSIIMVYLPGGPPHQDMYDLKVDAPVEIRGEFRPIDTEVPGIRICEHLPRLAACMSKLVPIRTLYGSPDAAHDSLICYTGRSYHQQPAGGWPALGSVVSKLQGAWHPAAPPVVGLSPNAAHPPWGSVGLPGFLGAAHAAFRPSGNDLKNMVGNGITTSRLDGRRVLLQQLDALHREVDQSGVMEGMDVFTQQAFDILTSSRIVDALDLSREPTAVRERYGKGFSQNRFGGAPRNLEHFLMARRLIEAGVRVVTLNFGLWDFHTNNFSDARDQHLPYFDQGMSALVEDLDARGMSNDVAVVAWGEFGRTPKINKDAGRDHWTPVGGALLSGGGFRTGQVIGATDRVGAYPVERPVHFGEVFASLYQHLGFDPQQTPLRDLNSRPHGLVDGHRPLPELS